MFPADPCSGPLVREDHPDLIQNAKKSDIPEKPKTPQQLWYTHEKKVYLKVRPDVSVWPKGRGGGHTAVARGEPRLVAGYGAGEQERRPLPRGGDCMDRAWASWRANECVCEPVPRTKADPCLSTLPPGLWWTLV